MRSNGLDYVPEPLGFDDAGNEVISYIEGETCNYLLSKNVRSKQALISAEKLLKKYHDVSQQYVETEHFSLEAWMFTSRSPVEVICHNDCAPCNICFKGVNAVGIIDFEAAAPAPRVWDVAYALYRFSPFTNPDNQDGFGELHEQTARAKIFCNAYGLEKSARINLVEVLIERLEELNDFLLQAANSGDAKYQNHVLDGHHKIYAADLDYIKRNMAWIKSEMQGT